MKVYIMIGHVNNLIFSFPNARNKHYVELSSSMTNQCFKYCIWMITVLISTDLKSAYTTSNGMFRKCNSGIFMKYCYHLDILDDHQRHAAVGILQNKLDHLWTSCISACTSTTAEKVSQSSWVKPSVRARSEFYRKCWPERSSRSCELWRHFSTMQSHSSLILGLNC